MADIASRYDLPAYIAGLVVFFQGWAKWSDGAGASGLAEMRRGLAIHRGQGFVFYLPSFETALAEAEASSGETDAGLRCLVDALAELECTEERWYKAEMHRIRAEILLKRDPAATAAAEQSLQAAIAMARSQKARSFELRAALNLARLWRDQGRRGEARDLLAPVYGWFTEGFDTLDLKETKTLLEELAAPPAPNSGDRQPGRASR
ncbi:MAG: hypothetical protein JO358_12155 [Alphaproteobacteria bacterium]|nr:hypothetical protein [Alphaproteobacteria bacterium]